MNINPSPQLIITPISNYIYFSMDIRPNNSVIIIDKVILKIKSNIINAILIHELQHHSQMDMLLSIYNEFIINIIFIYNCNDYSFLYFILMYLLIGFFTCIIDLHMYRKKELLCDKQICNILCYKDAYDMLQFLYKYNLHEANYNSIFSTHPSMYFRFENIKNIFYSDVL